MVHEGLDRRAFVVAGAAAAAFGPGAARAQDGTALLFGEGRYLPRYTLGEAGPGMPFAQFAAFVGDERAALGGQMFPPADAETLSQNARAEDAIARIVHEARDRRLVMLNETHSASRHRMFLVQLLRALRPLGFTHLAIETFDNDGTGSAGNARFRIASRFEPNDGTYSWDPVFAEALREAADLGYGFIGYEQRAVQRRDQDGGDPIILREETQAANLLAAIDALPKGARILVYVGFSHLRETPDRRANVWLAQRIKQQAGLDPLTIEQSATGSFAPFGQDSAITQAVLKRFSPKGSIVVQDRGKIVGAALRGADLAVFHPALPPVSGRPGWLASDPGRRLVQVKIPSWPDRGVAIAQAVHAEGRAPQVPADQHLLENDAREAVFFLRPGAYAIRVETMKGIRTVSLRVVS